MLRISQKPRVKCLYIKKKREDIARQRNAEAIQEKTTDDMARDNRRK